MITLSNERSNAVLEKLAATVGPVSELPPAKMAELPAMSKMKLNKKLIAALLAGGALTGLGVKALKGGSKASAKSSMAKKVMKMAKDNPKTTAAAGIGGGAGLGALLSRS